MDAPVLFFHKLFCNAEPKPKMFPVSVGIVAAVEAFENVGFFLIRDAAAGVGEGEAELPVLFPAGECDLSAGWSTNLKTLQSDRQRLRQCEKSGIESLYMGWVDRRNIFLAAAALMAICQIICLLRAIPKKHLYSES